MLDEMINIDLVCKGCGLVDDLVNDGCLCPEEEHPCDCLCIECTGDWCEEETEDEESNKLDQIIAKDLHIESIIDELRFEF